MTSTRMMVVCGLLRACSLTALACCTCMPCRLGSSFAAAVAIPVCETRHTRSRGLEDKRFTRRSVSTERASSCLKSRPPPWRFPQPLPRLMPSASARSSQSLSPHHNAHGDDHHTLPPHTSGRTLPAVARQGDVRHHRLRAPFICPKTSSGEHAVWAVGLARRVDDMRDFASGLLHQESLDSAGWGPGGCLPVPCQNCSQWVAASRPRPITCRLICHIQAVRNRLHDDTFAA